jgi:DNA-binding transcriptional LysR family regulator
MDTRASDLNAVVAFVQVVERRSFRGAAAALGVPKSTVSLKVAQLEDRLGARLLERTTRTLRLTEAGEAYYRRTGPAIDALREAEVAVADLQRQPSGRLRLTTTVEFGQSHLPAVIDEYLRSYPDVEVEAELSHRNVDLVQDGFDLAIRSGPQPDSTLIARALPASTYRVYASPAYLKRRGEPRQPAALRDHDCLTMSGHREPARWEFRDGRRAVTVEVRGRVAINNLFVVRALAVAGHGIVRLPEPLGEPDVTAGRLRRILDRFAPPAFPRHAVYPSARHVSPKVRAFIDLLERHLGGTAVAHRGAP